jgi:hypothetical protein
LDTACGVRNGRSTRAAERSPAPGTDLIDTATSWAPRKLSRPLVCSPGLVLPSSGQRLVLPPHSAST